MQVRGIATSADRCISTRVECSPVLAVRAAFIVFIVLLGAGCTATTSFKYPIEMPPSGEKLDEVLALYVAPETRDYVNKNFVNIVPYTVRFGEGVDSNAEAALAHVFSSVFRVEEFPSKELHGGAPLRTVGIEITGSKVAQGQLTFLPTTAELELLVRVSAPGGIGDATVVAISGSGKASAGAKGYVPIASQLAWQKSVTEACELAVKDTLTKMVHAVVAALSDAEGEAWSMQSQHSPNKPLEPTR